MILINGKSRKFHRRFFLCGNIVSKQINDARTRTHEFFIGRVSVIVQIGIILKKKKNTAGIKMRE